EIAKFRAARRLWTRIMRERFGAADDAAVRLRFHAQTAGSTLTGQQPMNNAVRVTLQAMAAVLGGCQSLHTNSYDEALALPTEKAVKLALRTQQILAAETGLRDVADPFGGSAQLEQKTDELEALARGIITDIDKRGGAVRAIEAGYYQAEIERSAVEYQREIEAGKRRIVGVNAYTETDDRKFDILKIDEALQSRRYDEIARIKKVRPAAATRSLDALRKARDRDENLLPTVIGCVKAEATLGEISEALAEKYGRYEPGGVR
ncbi:MAG TPA: methylmalonyl-CoA mutase family protein, partial [Planctomycetota bacterium]|nr:methylmalonyl-CoA mutase family protein [Planctomycetota bacterium]